LDASFDCISESEVFSLSVEKRWSSEEALSRLRMVAYCSGGAITIKLARMGADFKLVEAGGWCQLLSF
jgi:hypothetical protein